MMFLSFSCQNNEEVVPGNIISQERINADIDILSKVDLDNVIKKIKKRNDNYRKASLKDDDFSEEELKEIMRPLIVNGKEIHKKLLLQIETESTLNLISEEEKKKILMIKDDSQFIQLSILYFYLAEFNVLGASKLKADPTFEIIKNCVGAALGLSGIKAIFTNTAALGSVTTAVEALTLLGKRYLGYVGVAIMVVDFYDCYTSINNSNNEVN